MFGGFKTCETCRDRKNAWNERNVHTTFCPNCGQNVQDKHWEEHLNRFRHKGSELNLLFKDYEKKMFGSNLSTEEREQAKQEFNRKKEGIYAKLNEQYPNGNWIIKNE
jgi:Zn ribbon nucleic-acid-binding protein